MFTIGREYHKGIHIPIFINEQGDLLNTAESSQRYCLFFVEEGAGCIDILGHKELFIAPVVFCLNEKEPAKLLFESVVKARTLYFHPSFINERFCFENLALGSDDFTMSDYRDRQWLKIFFEKDQERRGRINFNLIDAKKFAQLFSVLQSQLQEQTDYYWPCRSRSYFVEMLLLLEKAMIPSGGYELQDGTYSEEIYRIILYLYTHYNKKITITDLVRQFNIDRTTLTKRFSTEVQDSIINYLIKLRIRIASFILKDTLMPISEVCNEVGFSDLSHFNKMFKKYAGCSPSEYRKSYYTVS